MAESKKKKTGSVNRGKAIKAKPTAKISKLDHIKDEVKDLHPLLKKLLPKLPNIQEVEYTHGAGEMGADFVVSKQHDTFGTTQYIGVIAKVGKVVQDYSDIERQIEECELPRKFFGGKKQIRIEEVWIVVTEHITRAAQEKIFEKYKSKSIFFLDGNRLEKLIDQYLPTYWINVDIEIAEYFSTLRTRTEEIDKNVSLLPTSDKSLYIEQDIYKVSSSKYGDKKNKQSSVKVNIYNVVEKEKITLIEGGMGAGKSKLVRHLATYYTNPEIYLREKQIPITITFKDLIDDFECNIDDLIKKKIKPDLMAILPEDTSYLILVDAVDEKHLSAEEQIVALSLLTKNINENPKVKALITTRYLKALDQTPALEQQVSRHEIRPLSLSRTIEFITNICTQLKLSTRIIEDLKKSQLFKELPKSPIAAIFLASLIKENSQDLPSNLTELYTKYIELMLGRWDIAKGLQSQKEYQALDNILMNLAVYLLTNELLSISLDDFKNIFESYLRDRNLEVSSDVLVDKLINRSELMFYDRGKCTITFKHRTFTEFFYAKAAIRDNSFQVDKRAFELYWMNTYFFYLGIRKDCPDILRELITLETQTELDKIIKIINMADFYLAAYATPYDVVVDGIANIIFDAVSLYKQVVDTKSESLFSTMSRMQILYIWQYLLRNNYSYQFFKSAMEEVALRIDAGGYDEEFQIYALFFLNVIYIDIGKDQSFDFLLEHNFKNLPLDITLALSQESGNLKERSALMKKQDKRVGKMLKGNRFALARVNDLYKKPINSLKS